MYEVPIKYVFRGDRTAGRLHMRRGAVLMDMLQNFMSYRDLKQGVLRRYVNPDTLIECDCRFGLRTVTITVSPGVGEPRRVLLECFANTTVALAYVLDVVGVKAASSGTVERVNEPVCGTCIGAETYPDNYYCTRGLRYTVAVCDGKGEYVLFSPSKAASTDYTPRCPGEQVLVMQHRTSNVPRGVLAAANANPMNRFDPFTRKLAALADECVSILPYSVSMMRAYEVEG